MRSGSFQRQRCLAAAALLAALVPRGAVAQIPTGAALAPVPSPSSARTGALKVWVDAPSGELDEARLQAELSKELGREVVLTRDASEATVEVRVEPARASVRVASENGEPLARSVDLPRDRARSVEVVAWLTVNLVRDEASELLTELRARRREEAEARAASEKAAEEKLAAEKASRERAAAAAAAARKNAEQAPRAANGAGGTPNQGKTDGLLREPLKSFDAAFATPISVLHDSPKRELKLQLALVYGDAGAIRGAQVGVGALRTRQHIEGAGVAVGALLVGGNARGVMAAVGFSKLDGNLTGVLVGGGAAIQRGEVARGLVIAGGGAVAGDTQGGLIGGGFVSARSLSGFGVAGAANVIRGTSAGPLVAGAVNVVRGSSVGPLVAGGVNVAVDQRGPMVAGGVNVARDLDGVAIAPINVQRRVRGLQVGVVNVADEVDGAAIGVLSFAKNGSFQPMVWAGSDGSTHVALKSTVGWAFTQLGAGVDLGDDTFSYDAGAGLHLKLDERFFVEPGLHYSGHHDTADAAGGPDEQQLHYLVHGGFRAAGSLDFLVGAGVRHTVAGGAGAALAPEARVGIAFF